MALSPFIWFCNHHHHPFPEIFSFYKSESLYPWIVTSPSSENRTHKLQILKGWQSHKHPATQEHNRKFCINRPITLYTTPCDSVCWSPLCPTRILECHTLYRECMASGAISSWQMHGETMETVTDFIFLGSKTTADGECSHEIKRCLLLGRKTMTILESIF